MTTERIWINEERNVSLTVYLQDVEGEFGFKERPAMLVLPGGGYTMCSDREADPVAMAYARAGYQCFILRYTIGAKCVWPLPLEDYEQAMALIEKNADQWHVSRERIAVVGFSAGGHLAACAATIAQHKPAAAVLVYPALLRDILDACKPGLPVPVDFVDENTCPCFFAAARDDRMVDIRNTLAMELALTEKKVAFESHIYSFGGHGFSTAEEWLSTPVSPRVPHWLEDSVGWLGEIFGKLTKKGFTEPETAVCMNADGAPVLSVMCSIGHLFKQPDNVLSILAPVREGIRAVAKQNDVSEERLLAIIGTSTLKEILTVLGMTDEQTRSIDHQLHGIVNKV